ncbi:HAMP domain-containing protein, partial [Cellulomonas sp. APG4]|uniref:sensor histidine kinase n=1 Tax=Cellulomonas sp. APG4 TaxID=1538656 RepID=UPI00137B920C
MLRRLGIRGKVLAALSVPVLVLFVLAGVVSLDAVQAAQTSRTMTSLLSAVQESREVATALQEERRVSLQYLAGDDAVREQVDAARAQTTDALQAFRRSADRVNFSALDPSVEAAIDDMYTSLSRLDDVRSRVESRAVGVRPVLNDFSRNIDAVIVLPQRMADGLDDRRLAQILDAHTEVAILAESYLEEQVLGAEVLRGSERQDSDLVFLSTLFPATDLQHTTAIEAVANLDLGDQVEVPRLGASFRDNQSYDSFRTLIATGRNQNLDFVEAADWVERAGEEVEALDPVQNELRRAATARANEVAGAELRTAILTIAISLAAVVASIVVAFAIARQIVNPLRRLTEAAGTVREELPRLVDQVAIPGQGPDLKLTTIPVDSRDEIGQLATAFNDVNATTIQVAQEQAALRGSIAEMFVNVARRDQVLLNRQLSFIDALERSEEDPKTLADLFRLDHLATRMRRNAESLLVLAGIDTGRRLRDPLPTSDVIRTASSEIEHYERIQLDLPVDPAMLGHTALPAAHMLAEILENATVFSDPGTPVHVSTGVEEDWVLITVLDQGLGMTPDELAEANTKIATTSAGDVLGSQRLGLFVVGRIAARLGARVELARGPQGTGTLVTVRMPIVLFVDAASIPFTPPTQVAAQPERFVLPEQAAEVVHEAEYAPAPAHVQDVAPGSVGSEQNPAEEVDLAALTDGTTQHGLPRRRSVPADRGAPAPSSYDRDADDAAAAPSIPLAPRAEAFAGVTLDDEEVWTPPVVDASAPPLVRRHVEPTPEVPAAPTEAPAAALPTRRPTDTGSLPLRTPAEAGPALPPRQPAGPTPPVVESGTALPTRQPTSPMLPPAAPSAPAAASAPAAPEGRAAMFTGFRSRRAELAAAAVRVEHGDEATEDRPSAGEQTDGAERLAAAAAFFGRSPAAEPTAAEASQPEPEPVDEQPAFVIPALVEDEESYGDPVFAPGAPAVVVEGPESARWTPQEPLPQPVAEAADEDEEIPYFGRHAYVPEEVAEQTWTVPAVEPVEDSAEHAPAWAEPEAPAAEAQPAAPAWDAGTAAAAVWDRDATEVHQPVADDVPWPPATDATWPPSAPQAEPVAEHRDEAPAAEPWQPTEAPAAEPWQPTEQPGPAAAQADPSTWGAPTEPAWSPSAAWSAPTGPAVDAEPAPATSSAPAWGPVAAQPAAPAAPVPAPQPAAQQPAADSGKGKKKRGWFGRKRREDEAPAPEAAPAEPTIQTGFAPIPTGFSPTASPVRQSAWGSSDGAHAQPEAPAQQPAPVAEVPMAPEVPTPWQPSAAPAAPATPAAATPSWGAE